MGDLRGTGQAPFLEKNGKSEKALDTDRLQAPQIGTLRAPVPSRKKYPNGNLFLPTYARNYDLSEGLQGMITRGRAVGFGAVSESTPVRSCAGLTPLDLETRKRGILWDLYADCGAN